MKLNIKYLAVLLAACFIVFSCTTDNEPFEEEEGNNNPPNTATTTFGIRHDKALSEYEAIAANPTNTMPSFEAVVMFEYSLDGSTNREFVGTGTLISPNWILTAGHNFFSSDEQTNPAPVSGIIVNIGNDPNNPQQIINVKRLVFHPSWLVDDNLFASGNDLCLVELETSITNITPAPLFTSANEAIGSTVWYSGFGDYSETAGQNPDNFSKKHAIENVLDRKISGITSVANNITYSGGLLAFDFDSPDGNSNTLGDTTVNQDEQLLGSGTSNASPKTYEGATVQGDSGGPLFVKDGSTWKVAGVLSGGAEAPVNNHKDSSYGDISIFIRVSTASDWIQSEIN